MRASQDELKRQVAAAALENLAPRLSPGCVVGVGTGSTTNHFIDLLGGVGGQFGAAVSSSVASAERLTGHGIEVIDLNEADSLVAYVDGADEVALDNALIKGGGGAHTREKIVAAAADHFICIVDESKLVDTLGTFPLPVEVIPMARGSVARRLRELGGDPRHRADFITDNGNDVIDVHGLLLNDPAAWEALINNIPGVVENGIFAANRPQTVLVGSPSGVTLRE
ncbi:MAG: ribose-5-phosphate isomerase RpiA [Gammaproteobacteria bacterium]|nr:ribose-5-phosphate isomerase RpiA [Gammaproteobacteria bacterium]